MAVGNIYSDLQSINNNNYLDIKPTGTNEASVHNIYHADDVELYFSDSTNNLMFDSDTGSGSYSYFIFHVNVTRYIRIKNISGGAQLIGFDGVYTKI